MAPKKPAISFRDLMAQAGLTPPSGPEVRPPEGSGPDEDLRVLEEAGENPGPRESDTQIIYPEQIIAALAEGSRGAAEALAAAGAKPETGAPVPAPAEARREPVPEEASRPEAGAGAGGGGEEERPSDEFNLGLDAEIARLLERTKRYVSPGGPKPPGPASPAPMVLGAPAFQMPPGHLTPPARRPGGSPRLLFDEAAGVVEEPTDHLGLLDSMDRAWQDEPTPIGDPRRKSQPPAVAPPRPRTFLQPSMTAPLTPAPKRKASSVPARAPSTRPKVPETGAVDPITWMDPPPTAAGTSESRRGGTTRRMRDTVQRVRKALGPVVRAAGPHGSWLTLGTLAVAVVWVATGLAAGSVAIAAVGLVLVAPLALAGLRP